MKNLILILIAFTVSNAFAQTDSLIIVKDIENLKNKVVTIESKIETFRNSNSKLLQENESLKNIQAVLKRNYKQLTKDFKSYKQNTAKEVDSLQQIIGANTANIQTTAKELGVKIDNTHQYANKSITDLNKTVSQNTLYWIIAILGVALMVLLAFFFLRKQIFKQKTDLDGNIQETRKVLEEEGVKLDNKLIEVLETQLKIIDNNNSSSGKEADHTLALKVADEIIRIQKNLTRMDEKTKGLKQLTASVKRIQDNFASNGYELVEMIGLKYDEGMHVTANFIPDDNLEEGERIITRIIKPQVNYKDVMIQKAQIEVSQG
ncbi:hypothetical protein L3073_03540 [Ancylomarina sp. DW003]|nr:hypothetical protein [Ancylomarina sp. DW003]MDE5421270.1 hypothetical protein [Ancylomarina sp. DW003]